jgi:putative Holliday junction resolvase
MERRAVGTVLESIAELKTRLASGSRLLGLDVGAKTIGMALSDGGLLIASPLETIHRTRFAKDAARLGAIIAEHGVGGLVIGLPLQMDGTEGRRCQSVRQFAANVVDALDIDTAFWDERLSTAAVERVLIKEADLSRRRRAELIDKAAAAYILQGALDALGFSRLGPK